MSHLASRKQPHGLTRRPLLGTKRGMTTHSATIRWARGDAAFEKSQYSREHEWHFDGGTVVTASASPHRVPVPLSTEAAVDPEEAFVAALSSCHMLWFLALASKQGVVVDSYTDQASGLLEADAKGAWSMTQVVLRPKLNCATQPAKALLESLHHQAHESCFLARSVTAVIRIETE